MSHIHKAIKSELANLALKQGAHPRLTDGQQLCGLKFRRQHPIGPYSADFGCVSKRLVVELDGDYHDQVCEADLKRQKHLENLGWQVIRFSNDDVLQDVEAVVRAIAAHLDLEYALVRRDSAGSGMMHSKSPTRSYYSRPSQREG